MKENHVCGPDSMCDAECMESAYRPSKDVVQGPWWTPTVEVERMMRNVQASDLATMEVDRKVLEGLLHDSLLWRQDRLRQPSETTRDDELRSIARLLPYAQQYQSADAADMEAQQSVVAEAERLLARLSPEEPRETSDRQPVARVPVHPKNGVVTSKAADRPAHYPLMPLYSMPPEEPDALTPSQLGQAIADTCELVPLPHPYGCECRLCLPVKASAPPCGNPVMVNSEWYQGCRLPSGHDG